MVAAFGFDTLAGVRILVHLEHTRATLLLGRRLRHFRKTGVRIENGDDVAQAFFIGFHQTQELFFELYFFLEARIVLHRFELGELFLQCFFGGTVFGKS